MLDVRRLMDRGGVAVTDVACRLPVGHGHAEQAGHHAIVFVRRGCFVRQVDGERTFLDPTRAYCINPGDEQRYDHPLPHGDDSTSIRLEPGLVASLWGGDPALPSGPVPSAPAVDLEHRLVLAATARADAADHAYERTLELVAAALEQVDPARVASGRPATSSARRTLVDATRELLADDPGRSLPDLAAELEVSAHHLSRTFRAATGTTIARHRMRLRARMALERIAGGEERLAVLAAELGFADQSHLCRVVRSETGLTPSALRRVIR